MHADRSFLPITPILLVLLAVLLLAPDPLAAQGGTLARGKEFWASFMPANGAEDTSRLMVAGVADGPTHHPLPVSVGTELNSVPTGA